MRQGGQQSEGVLFFGPVPAHRGETRKEPGDHGRVHSRLIAIYHVLKEGVPFRDLGADYYDGFRREHKIRSYLKRLQALGWEPELPPTTV